jgi:hypothetical protein
MVAVLTASIASSMWTKCMGTKMREFSPSPRKPVVTITQIFGDDKYLKVNHLIWYKSSFNYWAGRLYFIHGFLWPRPDHSVQQDILSHCAQQGTLTTRYTVEHVSLLFPYLHTCTSGVLHNIALNSHPYHGLRVFLISSYMTLTLIVVLHKGAPDTRLVSRSTSPRTTQLTSSTGTTATGKGYIDTFKRDQIHLNSVSINKEFGTYYQIPINLIEDDKFHCRCQQSLCWWCLSHVSSNNIFLRIVSARLLPPLVLNIRSLTVASPCQWKQKSARINVLMTGWVILVLRLISRAEAVPCVRILQYCILCLLTRCVIFSPFFVLKLLQVLPNFTKPCKFK